MPYELNDVDSPEAAGEQTPSVSTPGASSSPQTALPPADTHPSTSSNSSDGPRDNVPCLKYVQDCWLLPDTCP